jgi:hypothetical protein
MSLAIRLIRPGLTDDRERDEREMRELGVRLTYAVDDTVVELDPDREGIYTTIMLALRSTGADAVIVRDYEQLGDACHSIREHAQVITVEPERVLGRAVLR